MALDIEPLDIEPITGGLTIEPLDIEPIEETKKKGPRLKAPESDYLTSSARALVANIPGTIVGGLAGLGDLVARQDIDKAVGTMGKVRDTLSFTDAGTQEAEQGVGEAMAVPGQAAYGAVAPRFGEGAGTLAQVGTDMLLNLVDPAMVGKMGARAVNAARKPRTPEPEAPKSKVDSFFEEKKAATAQAEAARTLEIEALDIPQGNPIQRMAVDLGGEQPAARTPMTEMASQLGNREQFAREALDAQRADAIQSQLTDRQTALEQDMKSQVVPQREALMRQQMEQAPAVSPEHQAHVAEQARMAEQAQQAEQLSMQKQQAEAQRQAELQAQAAQMDKMKGAQDSLVQRQTDLEFNVKRDARLAFEAAERARQEAAPVHNIPGTEPTNMFSSGFDARGKDGESLGFRGAGLGGEDLGSGHIGTEIQSGGKRIGGLSLRSDPQAYTVVEAGMSPAHQGTGLMSQHYADVASHALDTGKQLHSDKDVSTSAVRVYDSLKKKGFTVERNPSAKLVGDRLSSQDGQPVFKVTAAPMKFPELSLAPVGEPLKPAPKFEPNAKDKNGAPIQVDRTVEQSGITYKVRDKSGEVLAQVSFEQNRDGSLGAGHVQSFARGRGAAEALYRKAKADGFTIRPGRAQTEEGAGLVRSLQRKGIVEDGPITPTSDYFTAPDKINSYEPGVGIGKQVVSETEAQRLGAMSKIPGMKNKLPEFEPDLAPTKEFLERNANLPDIQQNVAQKAMNSTSKGGQYVTARTNDPYIKRATQRVRQAVNKSQAAIRDLIHADDGYAPLLRSLSKDEYIETAQLLQRADKENIALSPDELRAAGFSEKIVAAVEAHKAFTQKLQGPLKEAAELAGIKDVDMRVAYAASRANHDFRVPVMKGDRVVGILTAPTRFQLENNIKKYKKIDGDVSFGPEQYMGGSNRRNNVEGFAQLYQWLSDQDPSIAKFADTLMEMNAQGAKNYTGAKRHTMDKKGVFGMAGDDPFASPYKNAKDFWDSQVRYGESVIKWAEMSKAVADIAPLTDNPTRPNANTYIKQYLDNAMGRNPYDVGKGWDGIMSSIGKTLGVGTELPSRVASGAKTAVNTKLLALSPAFLATNIIQPLKTMPEMFSFLASRGLDNSIFGHDHMMKGAAQAANLMGKNDPIVAGAKKYAEENHVYSSDLFEQSNQTRKNVSHYVSKLSTPASKIESGTRQTFYLGMVDALRKSGYTPENGLYQTSHNLTDMAMNNYNSAEAPLVYNQLGKGIGGASQNLLSFKQNELSRIAFFIEELKDKKAALPLITNLMGQVAWGGLMGTVAYTEADWLIRKISEMFGKPTSLTRILLTTPEIPDMMKYGVGSAAGIDLTSRMGLGQIAPEAGISGFMPGLSSLVDQGAAYGAAVSNPTEYNMLKAVRETMPLGPLQGYMDLKHFTTPEGKTINQNKGTAQVQRTVPDVYAKGFGVTGLNESMEKKRNYEESKIDEFYANKRKDALDSLGKSLISKNEGDRRKAIEKYVKFRGNMDTFAKDLERELIAGSVDERTRALIASQANNINNAFKLRSRSEAK